MIQTDQMTEYPDEIAKLALSVDVLVKELYDKDGHLIDLSDKKGRAALIQVIKGIPKEIPANIREEDRKLLREAIKASEDIQKTVKSWFWWVMGTIFVAVCLATLCAVLLLK